MRVLVWMFFGVGVGAIASVMLHLRRSSDWLLMAGVGLLGALIGGGVAQLVSVSADGGLNAAGFAALVGAVLFVLLAQLGLGRRRHWLM